MSAPPAGVPRASWWRRTHASLPLPTLLAERSLAVALVLAVFAGLTQWIAWLNREVPEPDTYVGPPRSDYTLGDFTLTSFDERGRFAFTVEAPRLARHPWVGSFEIDEPRFRIRAADGEDWKAVAAKGHVSGDSNTLKLTGDVRLDRPKGSTKPPVSIRSEELTADVAANRVTSELAVTVEQPGSILAGTGLEADLEQKRFALKRRVTARLEPRPRS